MSATDGTPDEGMNRISADDDDPALGGVAAAVGSASLTVAAALVVADGPLAVFTDGSGATLTIDLQSVLGWTFLAAHGVPVRVVADRWQLGGQLIQSPVVYAVPPVTLAVGGYLVARLGDPRGALAGARTGVLVTLGYVLAAAAAVFGTRVSVQSTYADIAAGPAIVLGLVAGVVYPVVFAGAGGAVAGLLHRRIRTIPQRAEMAVLAGLGVALVAAVVAAAL